MNRIRYTRFFDSGNSMLAAGVIFAVFFWFLEAYIHAYILFKDSALAAHFFYPDSHEFWMRVVVVLMVMGLCLYARRVVRVRKEAAGALIDSEELMRAVAETVMDAIIMIDSDANIIYWNPGAERVFGHTAEEAAGSNMVALVVPQRYHKAVIKGFSRFVGTGDGPLLARTVEMTGVRKDGTEFPVEHSISGVRLKGRWCAVGIMRDISERKQAGEALLESEGRFRMFFENEPAYCYMISPEGTILDVNNAALKTLGYEKGELVGRPLNIIYAPEALPRVKEVFEKWKSIGEVRDEEVEIITKGGERRAVLLSAGAVRSADGRLLHSVYVQRDVTERKRFEERIAQETEITRNLFKISRAIAQTTDISTLMDKVVENVQAIMGSDMTFVYLWDAEMKRFSPSEGAGLGREMIPLFRSETIDFGVPCIKGAFDMGAPVIASANPGKILSDIQGHGLYGWIKDLDTLVVVPLMGKREYLGLLVCVYIQDNPRAASGLRDRDAGLLRGIGHHVSIALEEARLYKYSIDKTMALSHKIETIQVMQEIDCSILSILDPQVILEATVNMIAKVVPCNRATIGLVDGERGGLIYAAGFGVASVQKGAVVPFGETSATEVVKTLRPQYLSDMAKVEGLLPIEEGLLKEGFLSHIRVPLVVKGEVAGVLSVGSKRPAAFTPDDLSTLEKLATQIGVALDNARLINDLKELLISTIRTLSEAIDAKSPWTRGHSDRVTAIALDIGRLMGLGEEETKDFEIAGLLHDIGKIGTLETILDKPGKLDEEELKILREHPAKGADILGPIRQLEHILPFIRHHHEFYDGTGYPDGLKGTQIPLQARILAVADTVDAMGSDRPYRKGMDMEKIVAELRCCSGTQFDSGVVKAFLKTLEKDG